MIRYVAKSRYLALLKKLIPSVTDLLSRLKMRICKLQWIMPKSAEQRGTKTIIISYLAIAKKKIRLNRIKAVPFPTPHARANVTMRLDVKSIWSRSPFPNPTTILEELVPKKNSTPELFDLSLFPIIIG